MMKSARMLTSTSIVTGALVLAVVLAPFSISQKPVNKLDGIPPGWSDDINLSNNSSMQDNRCEIAVNGNEVHVVWEHSWDTNRNIAYKKSSDGGRTWGPIITLYHTEILGWYPDIAVSGNDVHVVWIDWNVTNGIFYRNSNDGGETWNTVKRITPIGIDAYTPKIIVNNSNVHIIWYDTRDGGDGEIYYRRSLDGGTTWDDGQGVDQDRRITFSPATISGIQMAGDGSNISLIWADERDGDWEIYWMISKDNGFTWEDGLGTPNVGRKISNSVDDAQSRAVAVEGSKIHITWSEEQWPGPVDRIFYRNSTDNGVTWNPIQLLCGPNTGCGGESIDVSGDDVWVMWGDNRDGATEIHFRNSTDGGITWGTDTRLTEIDGSTSGAPTVALDETNIHVIWNDERDGNQEVYYKRYPDFPDTTPPSHTNETPPPDSFRDAPGTNVSVHVTDPSGVNESTIQLWVNGSLVTHTSTPIMDGFNVSYESPGFSPGVIECRIVADDNYSNQLDYSWNFTVLALYEIQLQEGWNLISVPHVQVDTAIDEVLRDIDGKWNYIQWYDASTDKWKTNATFKPESLNDLYEINSTMAFWINITEPNVNLTIRGHISTYTEIPLYAGWNLVGYSTQTTETVANALWGTGADRVEVYNATAPYRIKEVGPTYIMKPGEGYWVHVPADTIWVVNW